MGAPELDTTKEDLNYERDLERCDYDPWLLEDHPLRSHPTECIPGLGDFLAQKLSSARCKLFLLRLGCLIFACIVMVQCVRVLPDLIDGALSHSALS